MSFGRTVQGDLGVRQRHDLRGKQRGVACAITLLAASLLMAPPVLGKTGKPPAATDLQSLQKLWEQYPLAPETRPTTPRLQAPRPSAALPKVARPPRSPAVPASGSNDTVSPGPAGTDRSDGFTLWPLEIALGTVGLLLLAAVLTLRSRLLPSAVHIRPEGVTMPKFGDRKPSRTAPEHEPGENQLFARVSKYSSEPKAAAPVGEIELTPDYAHLGEHVGAVLEAAKEAADRMKRQAEEVAQGIRAHAEQQSSVALDNARKQAKRLEDDAVQLEESAREQSARIRQDAEAYASSARETADAEATKVREQAEQHASARVRATEVHLKSLDKQVTGTEQRLGQLAERLRELASSLDDLVGGSTPKEGNARGSDGSEERGSLEETLAQSVSDHRLAAQSTDAV